MSKKLILSLCSLLLVISCSKKVDLNERTLHLVVPEAVKGFDPIQASDLYSTGEIARVYEGLFQYSYLKRPYELEPALAASMPEVSKDGLTYTVKIKKGVFFQDNACFKEGKGRELNASDVVYSIKRLADAKNQSTGWWVLDGKLEGLNEWRKETAENKVSDYSQKIPGVYASDNYTVVFKLVKPFPQFLYSLAMPFTFIVPVEAVNYYGKEFLNNPVGTGAFITSRFTQSNKIEYKKNPTYREEFYPSVGEESDKALGNLEDAGKKLPLVDKLVVEIQTEDQPRWLAFEKGKLDYVAIPKDNFSQVVTPNKGVTDAYAKKGIILTISPDLDVTYIAFNHDNKILQNVNLRRAMSLATDNHKANELFYNNTALDAQSAVPPGIAGYDENFKNPYKEYNIEKAREYLKKAGYPDGKGLPVITYDTLASTVSRQMGELFRSDMSKIGIKIEVRTNTWPELTKKVDMRQAMTYGMGWGADYPDAENFLSLLYGPNSSPGSNGANYNNPEFNKIFEKAKVLQHGEERTKLYKKLNQMVATEVPWLFGVHRTKFTVKHGWLKNYKFTPFDQGIAKYLDINIEKKKELYPKL